MFASKDLLFSAEKYNVSRSLRFRAAATAYLNRTLTLSSRTTWTVSYWMKRGLVTANSPTFTGIQDDNNRTIVGINATDNIVVANVVAGVTTTNFTSTALYRDPSAWYHIVFKLDTTQATAADRLRIYVNGAEIAGTFSYPAQNATLFINSNVAHWIGRNVNTSPTYMDCYLAEFNFIDGQALTPTSFGFYDNAGIWQPKGYTGAYGTNGFYLNFSDNSAATATTIGKDYSGNGNNFTPNNISVTAGITYDSMIDSPTSYGDGSTGRGNYCVLNYINQGSAVTIAGGNLNFTNGSSSGTLGIGTIAVSSGKWYWEVTMTSAGNNVGIVSSITVPSALYVGSTNQGYGYVGGSGNKFNSGTGTAYGATYTTNDIIGVALDLDAGTLVFYKNNVSQGTAFSGLSGSFYPAVGNNATGTFTCSLNFGQRPFSYTPPSGFSALNTQNLTAPTIANGASYMAAVTYQGATAPNTVTTTSSNSGNNPNGVSFQPDLVWIKSRSAATDHKWTDAVRGTTKALVSNSTAAETTDTNGLTAFTASGFTVGSDTTYNNTTGPATYVAWEWNAGGAPTTDNVAGAGNVPTAGSVKINGSNSSATLAGSIAATRLTANTSAGFSIVTFTSPASGSASIAHELGVTPAMFFIKSRSPGTSSWAFWHTSLASATDSYLNLNSSNAVAASAGLWGSGPTSSVFGIGTGAYVASNTYVAYCFASVAGYSDFGSYTGNGSANGPFVYTGFRPRWVLIKSSSAAGTSWLVIDTSRDTYNAGTSGLFPNVSNAETTGYLVDFLSNGFKIRNSGSGMNTSAAAYIYAAFAENPFKISRAR